MVEHQAPEQYAYISHCAGIDFFKSVQEGMRHAAALLEIEATFEGTADFNLDQHLELLNEKIESRVSGIVTSVIDEEAFAEPIRRAHKEGIPVIVFNTDASKGRAGQMATVAQDTYLAGKKLGNFIIEQGVPKGKTLLTYHSADAPPLLERGQGIMGALKECGVEVQTLVTGNGAAVSLSSLRAYLEGHPDVSTLIGTGQDDTEAIGTYIAENSATMDAYGFDYNARIKQHLQSKHLYAVIDQQPFAQGFFPLTFLWLYRHKGVYPSDMNPGMNLHTSPDITVGI